MKAFAIFKNIVQAIIEGKLILRMHLNRHFMKILYCIFMCAVTIWVSLMIDSSLAKVKKNNDILKEQQYEIAIKSFDLSQIDCMTELEKNLQDMGSPVKRPEKPAIMLVRK